MEALKPALNGDLDPGPAVHPDRDVRAQGRPDPAAPGDRARDGDPDDAVLHASCSSSCSWSAGGCGFPYRDAVAVAFNATGRDFEIAIAIAITAFSPDRGPRHRGRAADRGSGDAVPRVVGDAARAAPVRGAGGRRGPASGGRRARMSTPLPVVCEPRLDLVAPDVTDAVAVARAARRPHARRDPADARRRTALRVRDGGRARRAREQRQQPPRAGCARRGSCGPAGTRPMPGSSTTSATTRPSRRARAALAEDPAMTTLAVRRAPPAAVGHGRLRRRGVARRLVRQPAGRELAGVRRPRARAGLASRRRGRVLPARRAEGAAAPDRDRDARLVPAVVRVAGAGPAGARGSWRAAGDGGRRRLRRRDAVLLVLGRAAVHRLSSRPACRSG